MSLMTQDTTTQFIEDPLAYAEYSVRNADVNRWPFRHAIIEGLFSDSYYRQLLDHFPAQEFFEPLNAYHPDRGAVFLTDRGDGTDDISKLPKENQIFWQQFVDCFATDRFRAALLETIGGPGCAERFRARTRSLVHLSLDRGGYKIDPHTDIDRKIVTAVIYLPEYGDRVVEPYGTSVLVERPDPVDDNEQRWDNYEIARTAKFRPNTLFTFERADHSWHGVQPVTRGIERRSIQYFVFADED